MNIGIICVRKFWNNAPSFLIEGLKKGISDLIKKNYNFNNVNFIFKKFTLHNSQTLYLDPLSLLNFDILLIPFWIGNRLLQLNLKEIKEKCKCKIISYTGQSLYSRVPPFKYDIFNKKFSQGDLTNEEWENFQCIDKFFVIKKILNFPNENEIEVGCGQFDFFQLKKSSEDCLILDFCKKGWDEFIWNDFKNSFDSIKKENPKLNFIQFGTYPYKIIKAVHNKTFVHYRRMCQLLNNIKIFVAMNESFGYPILENKFYGNLILLHENADTPTFYLDNYIVPWNVNNIHIIIKNYLSNYNNNISLDIRNSFIKKFPELNSWENTVLKIVESIK